MTDAFEDGWSYRGEGNSSLVIACSKRNVVCRLMKVKAGTSADGGNTATTNFLYQKSFFENVMKRLIGWSYLVPMKLVKFSLDFINSIRLHCTDKRPVYRLCKKIDPCSTDAVELPDLCSIPSVRNTSHYALSNATGCTATYSIEIKPKWGFMPVATESPSTDVRCSICRFCMHQQLKVFHGKWKRVSGYCPIHLFSGCPTRMKFALRSLLETPQNNLRLFRDGTLIWADELQTDLGVQLTSDNGWINMDNFLDLIMRCLLHRGVGATDSDNSSEHDNCLSSSSHSLHTSQNCAGNTSVRGHVCSSECVNTLPIGSVLSDILQAQKLCVLDIEDITSLHSQLTEYFNSCPGSRIASEIDGPFSAGWLGSDCGSVDASLRESLLPLKQFLVARSAKDCSIFISLRHSIDGEVIPDRHFQLTDGCGRRFTCCVSIIDLDPKPFDKIPFYQLEDREVVEFYTKQCLKH